MVGKPRHYAEATKLTKKSMKSAAKVVTREQHIGGPAPCNELAAPQQPPLTPYERMRKLLAQRDPVAGPVVVDTAECMCYCSSRSVLNGDDGFSPGLKLHV
ncbi:hypothetical protein PF005_g14927 [Phytophthora fragariae]|uniref:Uncharacterized protein n=1 Tax=Phytophthora fragariae TaxID=53985 RepID=A0A6A3XFB1_9STRA|nr:hypothetical protein PF003_g23251 [Phytophthora fragariae]KAE9109065.1 hypothetical protein PF007_g12400 [Phytophthora fragariae]KAE9201522.1 hypothetical protein PF005_g14927 [Phytophthora fragariae]KAE9228205.1 hypothetical protein PF002_g13604 [Phytophthora fragariae]